MTKERESKISSEKKVSVEAEDKTADIVDSTIDDRTRKGGKITHGTNTSNVSNLSTDKSDKKVERLPQAVKKTDQTVIKSTQIGKESDHTTQKGKESDKVVSKGKKSDQENPKGRKSDETIQSGKESDRATQTEKKDNVPRVRHGRTTRVGDRTRTSIYVSFLASVQCSLVEYIIDE